MMLSEIIGVQLREPAVGLPPEKECERRGLYKKIEVQNTVIIMSICFAYYC